MLCNNNLKTGVYLKLPVFNNADNFKLKKIISIKTSKDLNNQANCFYCAPPYFYLPQNVTGSVKVKLSFNSFLQGPMPVNMQPYSCDGPRSAFSR
jgi:hypothetical protein